MLYKAVFKRIQRLVNLFKCVSKDTYGPNNFKFGHAMRTVRW